MSSEPVVPKRSILQSIARPWKYMTGWKASASGMSKSSPVIRLTFIFLVLLKLSALVWVLLRGWKLQMRLYTLNNYEFEMRDVEHGSMEHGNMEHGSMEHGSTEHGIVEHGIVEHGIVEHGIVEHESVKMSDSLLNSRAQNTFHPDYNKYWDQVKEDVVICVKTGKEVQDTRMKATKNSWMEGRSIPHLIVVSDVEREVWPGQNSVDLRKATPTGIFDRNQTPNTSNPMENLLAGGWEGDKDKNLPAFLLMYKTCPRCKVFFLVDDDTYVLLENLAWNLLHRSGGELYKLYKRSYHKPVYSGRIFRVSSCYVYDHTGKDSNGTWGPIFAHGGAGIIMNNKALENMIPHIPACMSEFAPRCYAGDMQVSLCVSRYGGLPIGATKVYEFQGDHLSWMVTELDKSNHTWLHNLWNSTQRIITLHQLPEPEQELVHEFEMTLVGNQTFRDLKHFAWQHNISRRPKREWVKFIQGNQSRMVAREVMS